MASLSSYYPQPVIAGTTAGTYAEGNDSRIVGALPAATAGSGSVLATGSTTSRLIADRFAQDINIKDFGAVGDGVADDTLAIYRAICFATNFPEAVGLSATDIQLNTTHPSSPAQGGLTIPIGYVQQGRRNVIIPVGRYRITNPLPLAHGTTIFGDGPADKCKIMADYTSKAFNVFECVSAYKNRELPYQGSNLVSPPAENNMYNALVSIQDISIARGTSSGLIDSITRADDVTWYAISLISGSWTYATGNSGSLTITTTDSANSPLYLPYGTLIKFTNHSTVYEIVNTDGFTWTLNQALTSSVSNTGIMIGIKGTFGIMLAGGQETCTFKRIGIDNMSGAGMYVYWGSPAPTVENCMINKCKIAYWFDTGPTTLFQPSGDGNEIFLRCSWYTGFGQSYNVIGAKEETFESTFASSGLEYKKTTFQISSVGSVPTELNIIGSYFNATPHSNIDYYKDRGFVEVHRDTNGNAAIVNIIGSHNAHAWGDYIVKYFNKPTGVAQDLFSSRRQGGFQETRFLSGPMAGMYLPASGGLSNVNVQNYGQSNLVLGSRAGQLAAGIQMDCNGGKYLRSISWTRSETSLTFTSNGHGIVKGDYIRIFGLSGTITPQEAHPSGSGAIKVASSDSNTFTISVLNSGNASGSVTEIHIFKVAAIHAIQDGGHIFQLANLNGSSGNAFRFIDYEGTLLSGIRVPSTGTAVLWANDHMAIGGTIDSPASRILTGTGAPSASAPNGSIYLRTDGDPSSTMYVRAGNVWRPLGAYEP